LLTGRLRLTSIMPGGIGRVDRRGSGRDSYAPRHSIQDALVTMVGHKGILTYCLVTMAGDKGILTRAIPPLFFAARGFVVGIGHIALRFWRCW
jgi:hypothetical protein